VLRTAVVGWLIYQARCSPQGTLHRFDWHRAAQRGTAWGLLDPDGCRWLRRNTRRKDWAP